MKYVGYWFGGIGLLILLLFTMLIAGVFGTAANVLSTPGRVINEVVKTDNVINSYNGFYALKVSFDSKIQNISNYEKQMEGETDAGQIRIVNNNVFAMRAVCTELANKYNANAEKLTSSFFKDGRLPPTLNPMDC